jgi:hypothetical protein
MHSLVASLTALSSLDPKHREYIAPVMATVTPNPAKTLLISHNPLDQPLLNDCRSPSFAESLRQ